jgi:hypothetical protein
MRSSWALALLVVVVGCSARGKDAPSKADDRGAAPAAPFATDGFYVAPSGRDDVVCGKPTSPCRSIQRAIELAYARGGSAHVYVARGRYAESLRLYAGVDVEGGCDFVSGSWARDTSGVAAAGVVVDAPAHASAVVADDLAGAATMSTLTLRSDAAPEMRPGESVYAVVARGESTSLALHDVVVEAGDAGKGASGAAAPSSSGGSDYGWSDPRDGDVGKAGRDGAPAGPGTFSSRGYQPKPGGAGDYGFMGDDGHNEHDCISCETTVRRCVQTCTESGFGLQRRRTCSPSCHDERVVARSACGTQVQGGHGGRGGGGGGGGGTSVALFVWGADVDVTGGSLTSGRGGDGGLGGRGGSGDNGLRGAGPSCSVGDQAWRGPPGHSGGRGGTGGRGGGGSGGSSYAAYIGGGGHARFDATPQSHGAAGVGAGRAAAGSAADRGGS